jgi:hypothetical protein
MSSNMPTTPRSVAERPKPPVTKHSAEWRDVDAAMLHNEIIPLDRPAILRGMIKDWPATRAAARSPQALCDYLARFNLNKPVQTKLGPPKIRGRLFYTDDLMGLNFERIEETFGASLQRILSHLGDELPPAIYVAAVDATDGLRGFAEENVQTLLDPTLVGRLWAGNAVIAPTHYDMSDGLACAVAGHRRFTFFPPEQLPNLYVGPLDFNPVGQPTSMVNVNKPDFERHPRFAEALAAAEIAELEPGDAVFIPNMWWHQVEALDSFALLVNYWWYEARRPPGSPFAAMVHAILAICELPESRRRIWRGMFDHFAFQLDGNPVAGFPVERQGMLGPMTPALARYMRDGLMKSIKTD